MICSFCFTLYYVYLLIWGGRRYALHTSTNVEVRGQFARSQLSLSTMWVPGNWTQVVGLGGRHLYPLSHWPDLCSLTKMSSVIYKCKHTCTFYSWLYPRYWWVFAGPMNYTRVLCRPSRNTIKNVGSYMIFILARIDENSSLVPAQQSSEFYSQSWGSDPAVCAVISGIKWHQAGSGEPEFWKFGLIKQC